jgi:hypothetical protein
MKTQGWQNRGSSRVEANPARDEETVAVYADDAMVMVVVDTECGIRVDVTRNLYLSREGVGFAVGWDSDD